MPEADRVEDPSEVGPGKDPSMDPIEHTHKTASTILSLAVCSMILHIVVNHPTGMRIEQFTPGARVGKVIVCHAALDVEHRFDIVLPRLSSIDLLLADAERSVQVACLLGAEHAATIGHNGLRG